MVHYRDISYKHLGSRSWWNSHSWLSLGLLYRFTSQVPQPTPRHKVRLGPCLIGYHFTSFGLICHSDWLGKARLTDRWISSFKFDTKQLRPKYFYSKVRAVSCCTFKIQCKWGKCGVGWESVQRWIWKSCKLQDYANCTIVQSWKLSWPT